MMGPRPSFACAGPDDPFLRTVIDFTAERVAREGFGFELALKAAEKDNEAFSFLRDHESPGHAYYRYKVLTFCHRASLPVKDSLAWLPPTVPPSQSEKRAGALDPAWNAVLGEDDEALFSVRLDGLIPEKRAISDAVAYVLDRPSALGGHIELLCSRVLTAAGPAHLVALLYLASDLLHQMAMSGNRRCTKVLEDRLPKMFARGLERVSAACGRIEREALRQRLSKVAQAWSSRHMYPEDFLKTIQLDSSKGFV